MDNVHPYWEPLIKWLSDLGMDVSEEKLPVQARSSPGAGYGLFAIRPIAPSAPLFNIPAKALMNSLTLAPHYPRPPKGFTCTQYVALHLMLHRPKDGEASTDPLFGPYISVLPREFDEHPFTWLWKHEKGASPSTLEKQLLDALPPRVTSKIDKMANLFEVDWNTTKTYLQDNPSVLHDRIINNKLEEDYVWAWINVNTRCVYHRLTQSRSSPDNMTLCPILDFANHATKAPYTNPRPTNAEIWNTGPLGKRKVGDNFILLSPSMAATSVNEELYLRYGAHPNSTLFTEYGFVNLRPTSELPTDLDDFHDPQIELEGIIERLFERRGAVGVWLKDTLQAEGYWGDWTMHLSPAPAHPSYRLITSLRLYHLLPESIEALPSDVEKLLDSWRNTIMGIWPNISADNERQWRSTLHSICNEVITEATKGVACIRGIDMGGSTSMGDWVKQSIEILWQEEIDVAVAVLESLENKEEF